MNTDTPPLRDALLQDVRELDPMPVSTDQLALLAPPLLDEWPCNCRHGRSGLDWHRSLEHVLEARCEDGQHLVLRKRRGSEIYPHLRALERAGKVQRIRVDGHRAVYWALADGT